MSTLIWVPNPQVYLTQEGQKQWNYLASLARKELNISKQFSWEENELNQEKYFLLPSRAVGIVMKDKPQWLNFPLLEKALCLGGIEKVMVVLVNNTELTTPVHRNKPPHPYWEDTCTMKQVIARKFERDYELEFVTVYNSNSPTACIEALSGIQGDYLLGPGSILTSVLKGLTGAKQLFLNPFTEELEICP